jgi:hypothetical protein
MYKYYIVNVMVFLLVATLLSCVSTKHLLQKDLKPCNCLQLSVIAKINFNGTGVDSVAIKFDNTNAVDEIDSIRFESPILFQNTMFRLFNNDIEIERAIVVRLNPRIPNQISLYTGDTKVV